MDRSAHRHQKEDTQFLIKYYSNNLLNMKKIRIHRIFFSDLLGPFFIVFGKLLKLKLLFCYILIYHN